MEKYIVLVTFMIRTYVYSMIRDFITFKKIIIFNLFSFNQKEIYIFVLCMRNFVRSNICKIYSDHIGLV